MKAMLGAGGCAEKCTKSDIIKAYNTPGEGGELARRCYTAEGLPVCHNCQEGTVVETCNDLEGITKTGGCAQDCTGAELKALVRESETLAQCLTADGSFVCHNCWDMEEGPANCEELEALADKGGCAQDCTGAELKELAKGSSMETCDFSDMGSDQGSLAILPGFAVFLLLD
jgi:hypothetical protein